MVFLVAGWLADPCLRIAVGQAGVALVESRRGVTERHLELLCRVLGPKGVA